MAQGDQAPSVSAWSLHAAGEGQILRRRRLSGIESIRDGDLTQWDAAGMPQSFYLRLLHAEGESHYRQQFLSLLVCRPRGIGRGNKRHRTDFYLSQAKVKQIAITTVTWTFQGQRDSNRKDPKTLSKPTVSITFDTRDENCHSLQDVLELYELLNAFKSPNEEDRYLDIMKKKPYDTLRGDVEAWEKSPQWKQVK